MSGTTSLFRRAGAPVLHFDACARTCEACNGWAVCVLRERRSAAASRADLCHGRRARARRAAKLAPVLLFLARASRLARSKAGRAQAGCTAGNVRPDTVHATSVPPPPRAVAATGPAAAETTHFFPRTRFARGPCMGA